MRRDVNLSIQVPFINNGTCSDKTYNPQLKRHVSKKYKQDIVDKWFSDKRWSITPPEQSPPPSYLPEKSISKNTEKDNGIINKIVKMLSLPFNKIF